MEIKYLLDENVVPLFRTQLLREEPMLIVYQVGDQGCPPRGTLDPDILCWCEEQDFILVTNNRRSMPGHLLDHLSAGRHVPGIFIFSKDTNIGKVIDMLVIFAGASFDNEWQDSIIHFP